MKITEQMVVMRKMVADEGKVFRRIEDGEVLGGVLYLGRDDIMERYEEIVEDELSI